MIASGETGPRCVKTRSETLNQTIVAVSGNGDTNKKTYGMNISEVYERIRERESGSSAESRTRAELHIQKIKELREKHKAFIKMPHTKACDMIKYCLAIDRNLGINRIHKNAFGFIFFKYQ